MGKIITKISVFDFDGTLILTPLQDIGKPIYKEKKGVDWPHNGWWGKAESLDMDVFDMDVIDSTITAYQKEKATPNTLVVMMTGRIKKLSTQVEKILSAKGLTFDRYIYNMGGNTFDSKISSLKELMSEFPEVKSIAMWDDRISHIIGFKEWGDKLKGIDFEITHVKSNNH